VIILRRRYIQVVITPLIGGTPIVINPITSALTQPQIYITGQIEKQISTNKITSASLELYNLNDLSSGSLDFKKDLNGVNTGALVQVFAGYLSDGLRLIFSGIVYDGSTSKIPPDYITRVNLKNNIFQLRRQRIKTVASKGQTKLSVLNTVLTQAKLTQTAGSSLYLNTVLGAAVFAEEEEIDETLDTFLKRFEQGLPGRVKFSFDDAGVSGYVAGQIDPLAVPKIITPANGLIGSPEITPEGVVFKVNLDGSLRIGDPVILLSDSLYRLAAGSNINIGRTTILAIVKVTHNIDNRDGEFSSTVVAYFPKITILPAL